MDKYTETEYVSVWLNDSAGYPTFVYETKEQVVRCKDCRFYTDEPGLSEEKPDRKYCTKYSYWDSEWDYDIYHYVEPDGFCKWGERITANGGDDGAVM